MQNSGVLHQVSSQQQSTTSHAYLGESDVTKPTTQTATCGPMKQYSSMLESGALKPDRNQFRVVKHLQQLHNKISDYDPAQNSRESGLGGKIHRIEFSSSVTMKLYLTVMQEDI